MKSVLSTYLQNLILVDNVSVWNCGINIGMNMQPEDIF